MKQNIFRCLCAVAVSGISIVGVSYADTIGYWQFEGAPNSAVQSVTSQANSVNLMGAAFGAGGSAPVFSVQTPGQYILDGRNGAVLNHANKTSVEFSGQNDVGQFITITDGNSKLLEPSGSFTLEAFVFSHGNTFDSIITKEEFGTTGSIGIASDFKADRIRIWSDGKRSDTLDTNATRGQGLSFGEWHHIALVFDGVNVTTLYYDYQPLGSITGNPTDSWQPNSPLSIGGIRGGGAGAAIFSGLVDEVRFTNTALSPNRFLMATNTLPTHSTSAAPTAPIKLSAGWNYMWNPLGVSLGQRGHYARMDATHSSNSTPERFSTPEGGAPRWQGVSADNGPLKMVKGEVRSGVPSNASPDHIDDYTFLSYTIGASDAGDLAISNSRIELNEGSDSGKISIFVNDRLIGSDELVPREVSRFDVSLGRVNEGDTVYVAIGPGRMQASAQIQFQIEAH